MTKPRGDARARLMLRRAITLKREGFTDPEIAIYAARRISTLGIRYLRRERIRELKSLTPDEIEEWREQMAEYRDTQYAVEALGDVSPEVDW